MRRLTAALGVFAMLLAVTITAYRTLKPAEMLSRATHPLPSAEPVDATRYGQLHSAPLIIEGRLRVFAEQRRVFADAPVTAKREVTPHWAYRRWPAEVVAVAAVEHTPIGGSRSVVITRWSDGAVVALDAETGESVWQNRIEPVQGETYQGRRTGARTVYQPDDLFVSASALDGRPVVISAGRDVAEGFDPWNGTVLWTHTFAEHPGCHDLDWTSDTTYLVKDSCATPAILEVFDAGTGTRLNVWRPPGASMGPANVANWYLEPASCTLGRSGCKLFKAAATGDVGSFADAASGLGTLTPAYWNVGPTGAISLEPYANHDNVIVSGDVLLQQVITDYVWATSRKTGQRLWMSEVAGRLVAADEHVAYVINRDEQVLTINVLSGAVTSSTDLRVHSDDKWQFKQVYVHGGYMCLERLGSGRDTDTDERYYFSETAVVLVGVGS